MTARKTLQVVTLGCSKNSVDTEHLLRMTGERFEILPEGNCGHVDFLLVNTCGFIGDAKEESIQAILQAAERKKEGKIGRLVVFGCLSQRYMGELPGLIPEVDEWFGARDLLPVAKYLTDDPGFSARPIHRVKYCSDSGAAYAYLKISEGCDRRGSYCAIPHIRGAHKSVPVEDLVSEAGELAGAGVKELILIAQDTTFYGLDLYHRRALGSLVHELSAIPGIEWIRIHYSHPADFPEDVLEEMASNPKVCKYLDIPLQHISDKVLSKMRRQVDSAATRDLVRKLRQKVPGVVLRTTMIVGHPGEGRKEFEELLDFIREVRPERLGAFKYSEEEGTYGASAFRDSVTAREKHRRLGELMAVQSGISSSFNESRMGNVEKVMVDGYASGKLVCRSQYESPEVDGEISVDYSPEKFGGKKAEDIVGTFIFVRICGSDEYDLIAEPV